MTGDRDTTEVYASRFAELAASLPGARLPWLGDLRARAIERLAETGFPTRKMEAFKYTNLTALKKSVFDPAPRKANGVDADGIAGLLWHEQPCHLLVFADGRYRPDLSRIGRLPAGVRLTNLAAALDAEPELLEAHLGAPLGREGRALEAFNTAFMSDGALIMLDDGAALESPIHLLFVAGALGTPVAYPPRNLILAGAKSSATVLESFVGPGSERYWTNAVTQVVVGREARLGHYKLQREGGEAIHLASTSADLQAGSAYSSVVLSLGAALSRNHITNTLQGADIDCRLNGAYLARGRQHVDNNIWIDHAKPGSTSREIYKGVLDETAHGVFQGKITVRAGAVKSDAHQLNQNLLLSESARVDTKPELEIYADDVKCGHGATVGELDHEALFYLRSRGLGEEPARRLLIEAFVAEVVDGIAEAAVRDHVREPILAWLPRAGTR